MADARVCSVFTDRTDLVQSHQLWFSSNYFLDGGRTMIPIYSVASTLSASGGRAIPHMNPPSVWVSATR